MKSYIIASSKPWHRKNFDRFTANKSGQWEYVSAPDALNEVIESVAPSMIFFLHWNWRVPNEIWSKYECVCFHMTDLPYGRGGSPLQNLISAAHIDTTVTALRMVGEMDAGPVYAKLPMSLEGRAEDIYLRAGQLSWEMIFWIIENHPSPVPQEGEPTYFKRRKPEESELPRKASSDQLYDHIRMLDAPTYPLAFINHGGFRFEFSHAKMQDDQITARVVIRHQTETINERK